MIEDILDAIKSLEDSLNCSVCKKLLEDPVLFVKCAHSTCRRCFSKSCPVCGIPVIPTDSTEKVKEYTEFKTILKELEYLKDIFNECNRRLKEKKVSTEDNEQPVQTVSEVPDEQCDALLMQAVPQVREVKDVQNPMQSSTPVNTGKRSKSRPADDDMPSKENNNLTESDKQPNVLPVQTVSNVSGVKETPSPLQCSKPVNTRKRAKSLSSDDNISSKENNSTESNKEPNVETVSPVSDDKETPSPMQCSKPVKTRKRIKNKSKVDNNSTESNKQPNVSPIQTVSNVSEVKETPNPIECSTPINTRKRTRTSNKNSGKQTTNEETPQNQTVQTSNSTGGRGKRRSIAKKLSASCCPETPLPTTSPARVLNKKNAKGETQLHRAVIKGDIEKVKELIQQGASINTQDHNGWTPLHEASNHGFYDITKLLLDHGALVNVPSLSDNVTPIIDALFNDKLDVAILLASRGADLHAKASFGYCALDLCKTDEARKSITEACSPFIEANTILPISKNADTESDKVVFLYSNLDDEQKQKLQKCAQLLKAEIVEDFKPNVTHIVTSCDNMGNCTRTMKILLGMLSGKWLINFQWIEVCLEYKKKVDEEVFEVQGTKNQPNTQAPTKARKNTLQKFPPLFDGFYFYLHGTFTKPTPLREDLSNLIHLGGGKLLSREPKPDTVSSETFMMPYHAAGTTLENFNHIILYQDKPPRNVHINSDHICTTQVMWLISCINEYCLLPPKQANVAD